MFHSMSNNNKCPEWLSWLLHTHVPPKKVIWRLSSPHLIHISNYHTLVECEVKWALESITTNKASGGDKIPAELFQILKDDAVKSVALNMLANLENSAVATGLEKVSFHSTPK